MLSAAVAVAQSATPRPTGGPPPLAAMVQWHRLPSGLQYAEVVSGNGAEPHDGQTAVVHFTGWLDDGMQFDNSRDRQKPFGFQLGAGQVIKAWDEGVRGMRVGGTRRLIVPPSLGYGAKGVPGLIPPNATLTFDIELLRIVGN
jgi:FKBP-type peptidyl-prolyl cis-trans isomerase